MLRCIDVAASPQANQLIVQNDKDVIYSVGVKKSKIFSNRFIQADD